MPPSCGSAAFGKALRERPGRDVINTVVRALEVGQQMKNIVTQILIATVSGVLSSIVWAWLQAPARPLEGPQMLMAYESASYHETVLMHLSELS